MQGTRSKILSQTDVRLSDAPVRVGESPDAIAAALQDATAATGHNHTPEVSVDHDLLGNVVRIHVRCVCGEAISISCDYPDAL
ncbi:MAG: hypothetical protein ABGZ35_31485 [Planctomycetaceae bacterium]|jgi:hypothetical protein